MFGGGEPDERYPLPTEVRDWKLLSKFGLSYEQIQEAPAVWLDWMLAIDGVAEEERAKAAHK